LLSEAEQTLLHRLSVFAGGWTIETAEAVCAGQPLESAAVLDVLARLVDKSLVVVDQAPGDSVRHRLLETIRQYAAERLHESGEALAIQTRHAHFFLALAETAEPALHGPQQMQWFARLEAELDNLRAALAWSQLEPERGELGLRLAGALWWFWDKRPSEGRAWLEQAFAQTAALGCTPLRAKALREVGHLAQSMGDYATAQARLEESIAMWRTLGDSRGLAYACIWLIDVMIDRGDFARAQALAEEGLALCEQVGDKWGMAWALNYLATPALNQGDYEAARTIFERTLALFRAVGDAHGTALSLHGLGAVADFQGDYAPARAHHEQALSLFRGFNDRLLVAVVLCYLGLAALHHGDPHAALASFSESLALGQELGHKALISLSLAGFGAVASTQQQPVCAVQLLGTAEALNEAIGFVPPPLQRADSQRTLVAVRSALDEAVFATAWSVGRAMTIEQAIACALALVENTTTPDVRVVAHRLH
jgi:tetratricopeptide (TPR) repeat protein